MLDIIIADNQELTRFALEHLLDDFGEHQIYHASNKETLISSLQAHPQSVVLLDYTLFDFHDVDHMLIVGQRFPLSNWVLLSDDLTETFLRAVVYGSHNFSIVFKDSPLKEVVNALHSACEGQTHICQRVKEILASGQELQQNPPAVLTPTEVEVMRAIVQGRTTKEIAAERFSSIHTINTHRKNIFHKLGVNTAHEAIKVSIRYGLIDEADYFI